MSDYHVQTWIESLNSREIEILDLISEGLTNREIAQRLVLSPETIKWYTKQIYSKLGVNSRTKAVKKAQEFGLFEADKSPGVDQADSLSNLPIQLTSFVGRTLEIAEIIQLLKSSRLVVLTGAGGSGKSRLALQVAGRLAKSYRDGVWLVELASIKDPARIVDAIAHVLQVKTGADKSPADSLKRYLADKHLLLVLDNFEHLLEAAPWVGELLAVVPQMTVLATSRERIQVYGEQEYQVQPLHLPDLSTKESLEQLQKYDAIRLFVQRAGIIRTGFTLDKEQTNTVAQICVRLDGLPLAIELAAARTKLFTPQQMLERLDSRLSLLTVSMRDAPARQRTLRDTIDWSYNLLNKDEQRLFTRLAVFIGGFSLDAIEGVCGLDLNIIALDGVESLLNKNLLYRTESLAGDPRFSMLETIHEYARERLAESGEEQFIRDRHLDYYLGLAEAAELKLRGPEQVAWLNRLETDHGNLRAAITWSMSSKGAAESGLRLTGSLGIFWQSRGFFREGRDHLLSTLSRNEVSERTAVRAKALYETGRLAYVQGDLLVSRRLLNESISIYRELGTSCQFELALGLLMLGDTETGMGNYTAASSLIMEGMEIMRALEDLRGIARAFWKLGWCMGRLGEYEQASQYFTEALSIYRQFENKDGLSMVLSGLGEVALRQSDYERASALLEESLALRRTTGDKWGIAASMGTLAWVAMRRADLSQAKTLLFESLTIRRDLEDRGGTAWCMEKLAEIAVTKGQRGYTHQREGYFLRAARLLGAAEALRGTSNSVIDLVDQPEYERLVAHLQSQLDETALSNAWAEGENMTMDEAIIYALDDTIMGE